MVQNVVFLLGTNIINGDTYKENIKNKTFFKKKDMKNHDFNDLESES